MLKFYSKGINKGIETRGVSDHGFIESIYLRDPNGYVIELTSIKDPAKATVSNPHDVLKEWIKKK